jgi:addiction module HigA family antidote
MANVRFGYTPTHPGEVLKDEIEYRKISQRKLAEQTGMPYKALNDLLNGRRALTTATAMMFEAALDIPAESLMRLQLKYNMQQTASDKSFMERLNQIRKYAALL